MKPNEFETIVTGELILYFKRIHGDSPLKTEHNGKKVILSFEFENSTWISFKFVKFLE